MRMAFVSDRSGFGLVQVLVAAALIAGLSLVVVQLGKSVGIQQRRSTDVGTLSNIQSKFVLSSDSIPAWITRQRSNSSLVDQCLPNDGRTPACPGTQRSALARHGDVLAGIGSAEIVSLPLVDVLGVPLAGSEGHPHFLGLAGVPCGTAIGGCTFQSTGFLVWENSPRGPTNVKFFVKVERNPFALQPEQTPFRARIFDMNVGDLWKQTDASSSCAVGQIVRGVDDTGRVVCDDLQLPDLNFIGRCDPGQFLVGFENNTRLCGAPNIPAPVVAAAPVHHHHHAAPSPPPPPAAAPPPPPEPQYCGEARANCTLQSSRGGGGWVCTPENAFVASGCANMFGGCNGGASVRWISMEPYKQKWECWK